MTSFVELHAQSAFSFLEGAEQPETIAQEAARRGMSAVALVDRDGLYGVARFHRAAVEAGIRALLGSELTLADGARLPLLVEDREGWQNLCRAITAAKLGAPKGRTALTLDDLAPYTDGLVCLTGGARGPLAAAVRRGDRDGGRRALDRLGEEVAQLEHSLRRVRVLVGDRARDRRRVHPDLLRHFLDHHRLQLVHALVQELALPLHDRVAHLHDGLLALLDVLDQLDRRLVPLLHVVPDVLLRRVAMQQLAVRRVQPQHRHVVFVHQDQVLVALLDERHVRLDQPRLHLVVAQPRLGIEPLDELQRRLHFAAVRTLQQAHGHLGAVCTNRDPARSCRHCGNEPAFGWVGFDHQEGFGFLFAHRSSSETLRRKE